LVLERGRWWRPDEYPRAPADDWIWDQSRPERYNGWLDLRWFRGMGVAQGAGVGGGSLIFANVVVDANPGTFDHGWPAEITRDERHGAEIRPLHMVNAISVEPHGGYRVDFVRLEGGRQIPGRETAPVVVLAAGSLGSTELLLRCRDEHGTLPDLSPCLGRNWS